MTLYRCRLLVLQDDITTCQKIMAHQYIFLPKTLLTLKPPLNAALEICSKDVSDDSDDTEPET